MKHVFKTLASAFAIVAAASCAKEITPAEPSEIGGEQTAKFELTVTTDQNTKAAFDSDVRQLTWQEGDQIAVFDGTAKQVFTVVAESIEGGSAKFVGDVTEGATELYVAYPVAAASAASAEGMTVTIPSEQTVPEGAKADPEAFVMVGKVAAVGTLRFHYLIVCANPPVNEDIVDYLRNDMVDFSDMLLHILVIVPGGGLKFLFFSYIIRMKEPDAFQVSGIFGIKIEIEVACYHHRTPIADLSSLAAKQGDTLATGLDTDMVEMCIDEEELLAS